jgi:hypothetical protein
MTTEQIVQMAVAELTKFNNTTETNEAGVYTPNRSSAIDMVQKEYGLIGAEYCAMLGQYPYIVLNRRHNLGIHLQFSASTQTLWEYCTKRDCTFTEPKLLQKGDWLIWRKFKLWKGHLATFIDFIDDVSVRTFEGNVSAGRKVQGCYYHKRSINKLSFAYDDFYLRGFINVRKLIEGKTK